MSVASIAAKIKAECLWAMSAAALIGRVDRQGALLIRADQIATRQEVTEQALQDLLALPVENLNGSEIDSANADFEKFVDCCDAIREEAIRIQRETTDTALKPPKQLASPGLPKIDVPHFYGGLKQWLRFTSLFDSLVDSQSDLSSSQKMEYLISSLKGKALELVSHLDVSDENYYIAKSLLASKYHKPRQLAHLHLRHILALPVVTEVAALKMHIIDPVIFACDGLMRLGLPVEQWSFLLLHIIKARIPSILKQRFENLYGGDKTTHLPHFKDMLKFLEDCQLEYNLGNAGPSGAPPKKHLNPNAWGSDCKKRMDGNLKLIPCSFCQKIGHVTKSCFKFLNKTNLERRKIVQTRNWCHCCLGKHLKNKCRRIHLCSLCRGKHLELICRFNQDNVGQANKGAPKGVFPRFPVDHPQLNQGPPPFMIGGATIDHRRYSQDSSEGIRDHSDFLYYL